MLKRGYNAEFSVCCESGDVRSVNQDWVLARYGKMCGFSVGLFIVADGCGGMAYGEMISQLIIRSFIDIWNFKLPNLLEERKNYKKRILPVMLRWIKQINESAYSFGRNINSRVGSTMTVLLTINNNYWIFNCGDSRAYLMRKNKLYKLTEDQTLIADMLRNNEIEHDEISKFGHGNVLTMCVGFFEKMQIFSACGRLKYKDIFLLCSDGLYNSIGNENLIYMMPDHIDKLSAKHLRDSIVNGKAADNVSVVLVEIIKDNKRGGNTE